MNTPQSCLIKHITRRTSVQPWHSPEAGHKPITQVGVGITPRWLPVAKVPRQRFHLARPLVSWEAILIAQAEQLPRRTVLIRLRSPLTVNVLGAVDRVPYQFRRVVPAKVRLPRSLHAQSRSGPVRSLHRTRAGHFRFNGGDLHRAPVLTLVHTEHHPWVEHKVGGALTGNAGALPAHKVPGAIRRMRNGSGDDATARGVGVSRNLLAGPPPRVEQQTANN